MIGLKFITVRGVWVMAVVDGREASEIMADWKRGFGNDDHILHISNQHGQWAVKMRDVIMIHTEPIQIQPTVSRQGPPLPMPPNPYAPK